MTPPHHRGSSATTTVPTDKFDKLDASTSGPCRPLNRVGTARAGSPQAPTGRRPSRRPLSRVVAGLGLGATLALTGCAVGTDSAPTETPTSTGPSSTTASPPPLASATTGTLPTDPGIPPAARAHTIAGAEAFIRYYIQRINDASRMSDPTLLDPLTGPDCPGCRPLTDFISANASAGTHVDGDMWEVQRTITQTFDATSAGVIVTISQRPARIVDRDGRSVDVLRANQGDRLMTLGFGAVWRLDRVQMVG